VVVWPGGALAGPAAEVAGALDRLGDGHDDLDRAAVGAIRQLRYHLKLWIGLLDESASYLPA
jgi:hypothetical protein